MSVDNIWTADFSAACGTESRAKSIFLRGVCAFAERYEEAREGEEAEERQTNSSPLSSLELIMFRDYVFFFPLPLTASSLTLPAMTDCGPFFNVSACYDITEVSYFMLPGNSSTATSLYGLKHKNIMCYITCDVRN